MITILDRGRFDDYLVGVYMVRVGSGWGIFFDPTQKFGLVGLVTQPNPLFSGWVVKIFFKSFIYPQSIINWDTILNKIY